METLDLENIDWDITTLPDVWEILDELVDSAKDLYCDSPGLTLEEPLFNNLLEHADPGTAIDHYLLERIGQFHRKVKTFHDTGGEGGIDQICNEQQQLLSYVQSRFKALVIKSPN